MRPDKNLAIKLRRQKKSYNFISKNLNIPKSTLHTWFKNYSWSKNIKKRLIKEAKPLQTKNLLAMAIANKKRWEEWREKYRVEAENEFSHLKPDPLFISGLMLYWGEGDSRLENGIVRLSNTSAKMIEIFNLFLQKICRVPKEKIRLYMMLYPDLNETKCKNFWSKKCRIPKNQFIKTQYIKGKHPTKRLENGICMIHISSRGLKEKLFTWLNLYQRELTRD
jgi:hypothetical protein